MYFLSLVGVWLVSLTYASPSEDATFFKIHQATGYFEQFIAGVCPSGKRVAESLLNSIHNKRAEPSLNKKSNELRAIVESQRLPTVADVEGLRLSIHELMERQHLHHEQRWHDEVVDGCKKAKN